MARSTAKQFTSAIRYMFANRFGMPYDSNCDHDYDNNKSLSWADSTDTISTPVLLLDNDNRVALDHQRTVGARGSIQFALNANAALATQSFFIADRPTLITGIEYVHSTAGTDTGAVTCQIFHDSGTNAPGGGVATMTNTFNCKGTINTVQAATLIAQNGDGSFPAGLILNPGDRLSIVFTGVLTALAGVVVTVFSAPGFKEENAVYNMAANASIATQTFFQANRDCEITGVQMIWSAAGTDGGTVTLDVTHETGTTAAGSGTSILTAAQSAKTTANTVVAPALTATVAQLKLLAGDRLSVKTTGTLTALSGVVIVVSFQSYGLNGTTYGYFGQVEAQFNINANASQGTQAFFIADRDYEVVDASAIWGTAGSDAGTVTYDIGIAKGTTAPASATSVSTGAISVKTTANTTSVLPMNVSRRQRLMSQGDRLVLLMAGTLTSLANFDCTVSLLPR